MKHVLIIIYLLLIIFCSIFIIKGINNSDSINIFNGTFNFEGLSCFVNILTLIITATGLFVAVSQLKVNRESNHMPLLKLINCEEIKYINSIPCYKLIKDNKDNCSTDYFKFIFENIGCDIARNIHIYSINKGTEYMQFKLNSYESNIINDVEIKSNCQNNIYIGFSEKELSKESGINLIISYRNVYKDVYYGILSFRKLKDGTIRTLYFNENTDGYNAVFKKICSKLLISKIKRIDKNSTSWEIE